MMNSLSKMPVLLLVVLLGCTAESDELFRKRAVEHTQIDFRNDLTFDEEFNIYTYRNYYNGGGIAAGDVNNDGLIDLYFTGNQVANRLYLNRGDFKFEDVTEAAGVAGTRSWSTGVSMADINGDGWMDVYVCNSGDIKGDNKQNELFINQGDGTFKELAEAYGLADQGYSTHAAFFDYDKDGDLDAYLLNNSYQAIGSFNLMQDIRPVRDDVGGDKLFRNDNNQFVDVSEEAGIYGSVIGFGLGVTVGDVDLDGWQDIFVSNDFFERDYLYLNNGDGTFTEDLVNQMPSISAASMGADMADFNNDGLPDIFVTDMLPEPDERIKKVTTFESWDKYQYKIENDYHKQLNRNMLHMNNGDGTFSEIGRLSGVEATDWSWAALMFDMDNDGLKDLFIANGIYQDITDLDYLNFISDDEVKKQIITREGVDYKALVDPIPINPIPNYALKNTGELGFENMTDAWGFAEPTHSNGSAYVDLDNDGDMDLVVNNVNSPSAVYENLTNEQLQEHHFLKIVLQGEHKNTTAVGAQVWVRLPGKTLYQEQMPIRGFQSTVDNRLNFGLGTSTTIEELKVVWPSGKVTIVPNLPVDQVIELQEAEGTSSERDTRAKPIAGQKMMVPSEDIIHFEHEENTFVDFDRDRLTYHMLSQEGPKLATSDVNADGLVDVFVSGAKDRPSALFVQTMDNRFALSSQPAIEGDARSEDVGAVFFDADGDGDQDLYVASGGNEFSLGAPPLKDRLYLNDGTGIFTKKEGAGLDLPSLSTSVAAPTDFDGDGDVDLFLGTRVRPFQYGVPASSILLENDGSGNFSNMTEAKAKGLIDLGMVTDGSWFDFDDDGDDDLVVVGEWMPVEIFENEDGMLTRVTETALTRNYRGWWNTLKTIDLDNDGDQDIIAGNHGLNSRFRASAESPLSLYIHDFDENGSIEHIFCHQVNGEEKPLTLKHELVAQIPELKKKYLKYEAYMDQRMIDIFPEKELQAALRLSVNHLASTVFWNQGDGTFKADDLPREAQFTPIYAIEATHLTEDNMLDIIVGGNLYDAKPQAGPYDASYGLVLMGNGNGFEAVKPADSGFFVEGEIRDLKRLSTRNAEWLLVARNNNSLITFGL